MSRVLNVILTHQAPAAVEAMLAWWRDCVPLEGILLAYGGNRENFAALAHPQKVFITDPRLRTVDHQRECQSYTGLFREVAGWLAGHDFTHVSFCEYDHLPIVADFNARQLARLEAEKADVIGYQILRIDGTNQPHYLHHCSNPEFHRFWAGLTCRPQPEVILNMFGSGSFWTRAAFAAVAASTEPFPIYLELFLPNMAHHLGFRVRDLPDQNTFVQVFNEMEERIEESRRLGAWAVHPVKHRWTRQAGA